VKFTELPLAGAYVVAIELHADARGFFARSFCAHEFDARGLESVVAQCNLSFNARRGTVRGLHFDAPPAGEAKLVRCTRGAILDVIVDVRADSPTYLQHASVELSAQNHLALYVPRHFAHGFQTLDDDTEVLYQMSDFYRPGHERGLRHDDPRLAIRWPLPASAINDRDRDWPLLSPAAGATETS
jgi:dTDP-4-dehydrorhamnose 3,5-epimerase